MALPGETAQELSSILEEITERTDEICDEAPDEDEARNSIREWTRAVRKEFMESFPAKGFKTVLSKGNGPAFADLPAQSLRDDKFSAAVEEIKKHISVLEAHYNRLVGAVSCRRFCNELFGDDTKSAQIIGEELNNKTHDVRACMTITRSGISDFFSRLDPQVRSNLVYSLGNIASQYVRTIDETRRNEGAETFSPYLIASAVIKDKKSANETKAIEFIWLIRHTFYAIATDNFPFSYGTEKGDFYLDPLFDANYEWKNGVTPLNPWGGVTMVALMNLAQYTNHQPDKWPNLSKYLMFDYLRDLKRPFIYEKSDVRESFTNYYKTYLSDLPSYRSSFLTEKMLYDSPPEILQHPDVVSAYEALLDITSFNSVVDGELDRVRNSLQFSASKTEQVHALQRRVIQAMETLPAYVLLRQNLKRAEQYRLYYYLYFQAFEHVKVMQAMVRAKQFLDHMLKEVPKNDSSIQVSLFGNYNTVLKNHVVVEGKNDTVKAGTFAKAMTAYYRQLEAAIKGGPAFFNSARNVYLPTLDDSGRFTVDYNSCMRVSDVDENGKQQLVRVWEAGNISVSMHNPKIPDGPFSGIDPAEIPERNAMRCELLSAVGEAMHLLILAAQDERPVAHNYLDRDRVCYVRDEDNSFIQCRQDVPRCDVKDLEKQSEDCIAYRTKQKGNWKSGLLSWMQARQVFRVPPPAQEIDQNTSTIFDEPEKPAESKKKTKKPAMKVQPSEESDGEPYEIPDEEEGYNFATFANKPTDAAKQVDKRSKAQKNAAQKPVTVPSVAPSYQRLPGRTTKPPGPQRYERRDGGYTGQSGASRSTKEQSRYSERGKEALFSLMSANRQTMRLGKQPALREAQCSVPLTGNRQPVKVMVLDQQRNPTYPQNAGSSNQTGSAQRYGTAWQMNLSDVTQFPDLNGATTSSARPVSRQDPPQAPRQDQCVFPSNADRSPLKMPPPTARPPINMAKAQRPLRFPVPEETSQRAPDNTMNQMRSPQRPTPLPARSPSPSPRKQPSPAKSPRTANTGVTFNDQNNQPGPSGYTNTQYVPQTVCQAPNNQPGPSGYMNPQYAPQTVCQAPNNQPNMSNMYGQQPAFAQNFQNYPPMFPLPGFPPMPNNQGMYDPMGNNPVFYAQNFGPYAPMQPTLFMPQPISGPMFYPTQQQQQQPQQLQPQQQQYLQQNQQQNPSPATQVRKQPKKQEVIRIPDDLNEILVLPERDQLNWKLPNVDYKNYPPTVWDEPPPEQCQTYYSRGVLDPQSEFWPNDPEATKRQGLDEVAWFSRFPLSVRILLGRFINYPGEMKNRLILTRPSPTLPQQMNENGEWLYEVEFDGVPQPPMTEQQLYDFAVQKIETYRAETAPPRPPPVPDSWQLLDVQTRHKLNIMANEWNQGRQPGEWMITYEDLYRNYILYKVVFPNLDYFADDRTPPRDAVVAGDPDDPNDLVSTRYDDWLNNCSYLRSLGYDVILGEERLARRLENEKKKVRPNNFNKDFAI